MTIPELFQKLPDAHEPLDGWCGRDKAFTLASIVVASRPSVIVEIGVYGGKSLIPMALALKAVNPQGICIGIDPWDKKVAVREQTTPEDREWWNNLDLDAIHAKFMAALTQHELTDICRIERKESRAVGVPESIGVFHCDGAHSDTATNDIVRFSPRVVVGGYVVTDDSDWHGGGVTRGERRLLETGFKRLYALGTGSVFQRIK